MPTEIDSTVPFIFDTNTGRMVGYQDKSGKERGMSGAEIPSGADPSAPISVGSSFILAASDDGKVFNVTTAITVTIPNGLSPRPNVAFIPPPTGNLSIAVSGGALINGAATTLTRARSANPAGIVVQPYTESDGYGVSGV